MQSEGARTKGSVSKNSVLAEPAWLEGHLDDPKLRVVEVVGLMLPPNLKGHIRGSVLVDWRKEFWQPTNREFVNQEQFEKLMGRLGISNSTTVVFYSLLKQFATYAFWLFKYYGHADARVLNGGFQKWTAENRPLFKESTAPEMKSLNYVAETPDESIRAKRDYILSKLGDRDMVLIDSRSPQEYRGELINTPGWPQEGAYCSGHIPGAISVYLEENVKLDESFKPPDELRRLYESKGITPNKEVITYCRSGHQSSHTWFVLKHLLGYPNVKRYDGSWTEWGNLVGAPIEK